MFIDSGKVTFTWGEERPLIITREKLKKDAATEERKDLIAKGWRRT